MASPLAEYLDLESEIFLPHFYQAHFDPQPKFVKEKANLCPGHLAYNLVFYFAHGEHPETSYRADLFSGFSSEKNGRLVEDHRTRVKAAEPLLERIEGEVGILINSNPVNIAFTPNGHPIIMELESEGKYGSMYELDKTRAHFQRGVKAGLYQGEKQQALEFLLDLAEKHDIPIP